MTIEKPYEDGHGALSFADDFAPFKLNASGVGSNTQLSEVMAAFPYPPKNCDDAVAILGVLDQNIKQRQEQIASDVAVTTGKKYLDAYMQVRNNFNTYIIKSRCLENALKQEDEAFNQEWKGLLDKEEAKQSSSSTGNSWLIYGIIGIIVVGGLVIILKKKKA